VRLVLQLHRAEAEHRQRRLISLRIEDQAAGLIIPTSEGADLSVRDAVPVLLKRLSHGVTRLARLNT
jgi:hypothetical protein